MRRCLLAVLLLSPSVASAGPIEWSYSASVRTTTGLGLLDLGTETLGYHTEPNGNGEWVTGEYTLTVPLYERTVTGSGYDTSAVPVVSIGDGFRVHPVADAPAVDPGFVIAFTLTDAASSESGTIEYKGTAGVAVLNELDNLRRLYSAGVGPEAAELRLGANRYRVTTERSYPGDIEEEATIWLNVSVTQDTPEPGTLLLAGLGLAAAGLVRRFTRGGQHSTR